jgi:rSAM/selenodomain-associated transferase 1
MRRAIIVIGKAPAPGAAKTRLVPPLTADEAAALYRGFLLDTVQLAQALGWEHTALVHPRGDGPFLQALTARTALLEQPRTGIGDALAYAFERHFAVGCDSVVLIGSDNPTLPAAPIRAAQAALRTPEDLSIGPSADGGYYLIGMRRPYLALFDGIDWSTSRVYAQTLGRAGDLGLRVHAVEEWYDVDEPADLERLAAELERLPARVAPNTRAVLDRLRPTRERAAAAFAPSARRRRA